MAELVILGPEATHRKRRPLPERQRLRLGRAPQSDVCVPWDPLVSREHAEVEYRDGQLHVWRLERARNPIYHGDRDAQEFAIGDGGEFRIGHTQFRLMGDTPANEPPESVEEHVFPLGALPSFAFRKADHWLEVLSGLPELIEQSRTDEEFAQRLVQILLSAVPQAEAAAVVVHEQAAVPSVGGEPGAPRILQWDTRGDVGSFRPSRRLVLGAVGRGESILHVWNAEDSQQKYTYSGHFDWAFCVPMTEPACRGWCLYVSGSFGDESAHQTIIPSGESLQEELRFAELLAQFIGSIRQMRMLEHQQAGLGQFFSPAVRTALTGAAGVSTLAPRETEITVLFCDVHGESRPHGAPTDLDSVVQRINRVMRTMTRGIFQQDGVVADFQGNAALGFWGWPVGSPDGPLRACRAALAIQQMFRQAIGERFRVGIGIAHGTAIAGKIGTEDQAKLGVFGPVVNLGSRLQGMTRQLRASILIDDATAQQVRATLPPTEARIRRLGRIRPYGMEDVVAVCQLLPPVSEVPAITDQNIRDFEAAVDAVADGRWPEALALLDNLPIADRTKDFLMLFIALNGYDPPAHWDGIFALQTK